MFIYLCPIGWIVVYILVSSISNSCEKNGKKNEEILSFINNEITRVPLSINNKLTRKDENFSIGMNFMKLNVI